MTDPGRGDVVLALTTAPDEENGERLAATLLDERLIACANLVPGVRSLYRWEGAVQRDAEVLLLLKSTRDCVERLERRVDELHPYDVPELLVLDVADGLAAYLEWVGDEVEAGDG